MIVNISAYEDGKRLGDITIDEISDVLQRPHTFVWVGLYEPDDDLLAKMKEEFGLHELAVEDARIAHQRPKIETYGGTRCSSSSKTANLKDKHVAYGETHLFVGAELPRDRCATANPPATRSCASAARRRRTCSAKGAGLRGLRDPRLRRRQLPADHRAVRGRLRRARGRHLQERLRSAGRRPHLRVEARAARTAQRGAAGRRHRQRADALPRRPDPEGTARVLPRRQGPRRATRRHGRQHARNAELRDAGQPRAWSG